MYSAELVVKLVCAGMLSSLSDDTDRHRYRLAHRLVRADGIGDWAATLDEILVGPAAQCLLEAAQTEQRELTQKLSSGSWQYDSVVQLDRCLRLLDKNREGFPFKLEGKRWSSTSRNLETKRGHMGRRDLPCVASYAHRWNLPSTS
jgi:hypothetical protein